MARKARQRAQSGVYYVRADSADKLVFPDPNDRQVLADLLTQCAADDMTEVWAYAFLDEQLHFVIKEGLDGVSRFLRAALSKYALWYNAKYARAGRLFADRFRSLPLEEADDMLAAARYVLTAGEPDVTNIRAFLRDNEELTAYAGGKTALKAYLQEKGTFCGFDRAVISDADLLAAVRALLLNVGADRLDLLSEEEYLAVLRAMLAIPGATVGQVSRVCGISRRQLLRAQETKSV